MGSRAGASKRLAEGGSRSAGSRATRSMNALTILRLVPKWATHCSLPALLRRTWKRGYEAAVSGISCGAPVLEGLCDSAASVLDLNPLPLARRGPVRSVLLGGIRRLLRQREAAARLPSSYDWSLTHA